MDGGAISAALRKEESPRLVAAESLARRSATSAAIAACHSSRLGAREGEGAAAAPGGAAQSSSGMVLITTGHCGLDYSSILNL